MITLSLVILAFFTNPDTNSLATASKKKMEEGRLKDSVTSSITSRIAAAVLLDTRYERKNYYVFSIGVVTHRLRLGGPEVKIELLGAFGHWWFEFVDTPLYDPAL